MITEEIITNSIEDALCDAVRDTAREYLNATGPRCDADLRTFSNRIALLLEISDQLVDRVKDDAFAAELPVKAAVQADPGDGPLLDLKIIKVYDADGNQVGACNPPPGTKAALLADSRIIALAADGGQLDAFVAPYHAARIESERVVPGVDTLGPIEAEPKATTPPAE